VQATAAAGLAWDEAYARWRAAEACLPRRSDRPAGVAHLRRAQEMAAGLSAVPLLEQITSLATSAGVTLTSDGPAPAPAAGEEAPSLPGLTARENEILRLVVAGHTYREIARALVISEKTVSAHISSMLRKTGTASRTELAQKYRRLTATPAG
jgi:DNA-binding CsgD family transcriptional regulator